LTLTAAIFATIGFIACPYIVEKNLAHLDAKTSEYEAQ
jgi:hypothetical protein